MKTITPRYCTPPLQRFAEFLQHVIRKRRAHAQYGSDQIHHLTSLTRLSLLLRTLFSDWLHCRNDRSTVKFDKNYQLSAILTFKHGVWAWPLLSEILHFRLPEIASGAFSGTNLILYKKYLYISYMTLYILLYMYIITSQVPIRKQEFGRPMSN